MLRQRRKMNGNRRRSLPTSRPTRSLSPRAVAEASTQFPRRSTRSLSLAGIIGHSSASCQAEASISTDIEPAYDVESLQWVKSTTTFSQASSCPDSPVIVVPYILVDAPENSSDDKPSVVRPLGYFEDSSGHDTYDREEPLITKTKKFYKKRAPLIPRYDDSEESLVQNIDLGLSTIKKDGRQKHPPGESPAISFDSISPGFSSNEMVEKVSSSRGSGLRMGHGFIYMIIPPDGGFGWVIMLLSFLSQVIVDGIILSIGILLPDIAKEFGIAGSTVVIVASVQIGCYFTFGAIASAMINRFGFRPVAIIGVISSSLVIFAASFAPNQVVLVLLYGAIGGSTLSMIWVSSQLIVGYYFERYRPIANGFSCSGAGIGLCVFSFLTSWLLPHIGWRNMLRVQVGVLLLILIMTIGYMEVPPTPVGVYNDEASDTSSHEYYDKFYVHDYLRFVSRDVSPAPSVMSTYDPQQDTRSLKSLWTKKPVTNPSTPRNRSEHHLLIKPEPMQRDDLFYTGPADYEEQQHSKENLEGKEIILQGSDRHTRKAQYGLAHIHKSDEMEANKSNHSLQSKQSTKSGKSRIFRRTNSKFMRGLTTLFDYHMLSQFEFRVLVASAFLYPMGFNIPFVYSKVRTTIPPSQAAFIGPAIGISNFAVRIVCGFVAFKRRSLTTSTCGGGLIFGGAFVFLSAFYGKDKFWFQIVYGLCYGVAPAVYSTLRAIIYVKYVGLSKLTNAFGICALAMGLGVFIGTTVGGMLVGLTDDYTGPFAFAGLCIIVSGLLKLTLPKMVEMRKRKREG